MSKIILTENVYRLGKVGDIFQPIAAMQDGWLVSSWRGDVFIRKHQATFYCPKSGYNEAPSFIESTLDSYAGMDEKLMCEVSRKVNYPVSGIVAGMCYTASDKEDLNKLINALSEKGFTEHANAIMELYPSEFPQKTIKVELTQQDVDTIHLVFGYVAGDKGYSVSKKINDFVSEKVYDDFDLVSYEVNSDDGLTLKLEDF